MIATRRGPVVRPGTMHLLASLFARDEGLHDDSTALLGLVVTVALVAASILGFVRSRGNTLAELRDEEGAGDSLTHVAHWFLQMRWLASGIAAVLVLATVEVAHQLGQHLLLPLLLCIVALAGANQVFSILLRRRSGPPEFLVGSQVVCDLVILTLMLHFSGGIENPLSLLFIFHVIIAGILFARASCYRVVILSVVMFAVLALAEFWEFVPHYTLEVFPHQTQDRGHLHASHNGPYVVSRILLQAVLLFTTAYFITTIMEGLRVRERRARSLAQRETEARERLESVVEAAGAGLRLLDSDLRPIWSNARFDAWAEAEDELLETARHTLADSHARVTEHRREGKQGRPNFYATTTAAMAGPDGEAHSVVQLVQDVTARREAEAQVLHTEKLAAVGELAGNVAHEINNPLGILSTRLHLMRRKPASEEAGLGKDLDKMVQLAERITSITRALLGYCRPDQAERRPVLLGPALDRTRELTTARARARSVRISYACDPAAPQVLGNPGEIEQVVLNLAVNAIDATPKDGQVRVSAGPNGDGLLLAVDDSGPGVPVDLRERIFEPFFSTKKSGEGTGLGLSICKRIVREHGGTLEVVDSALGGARFEVRLPSIQSKP
jgi:signal transduction histidine kinase